MNLTTEEVLKIIQDERKYQIEKWGNDENKSLGDFLTFIDVYLTEAKVSLTKTENTDFVENALRKIAALSVAALERHGCITRELFQERYRR